MAEPHPWNTDFTWTDRGNEAFDRDGFFVVPRLLTADEVAAAVAETDRLEAEADAFLAAMEDERLSIAERGAITFSIHLVAKSQVLAELSRHPRIVELCAELIGPDVRLYWDQAVYKKPEKPRRFPWHQDNGYAFVEPQQYLTVWLALTDATNENGCPWVVPGLHRDGTLRHTYVEPLGFECLSDPEGAVAAPVPAGGAVVFSSLTPHLTGPNTTGSVRKAYILQYAPDGAEILRGDADAGPPQRRETADAPDRQFPVLIGGEPVRS